MWSSNIAAKICGFVTQQMSLFATEQEKHDIKVDLSESTNGVSEGYLLGEF